MRHRNIFILCFGIYLTILRRSISITKKKLFNLLSNVYSIKIESINIQQKLKWKFMSERMNYKAFLFDKTICQKRSFRCIKHLSIQFSWIFHNHSHQMISIISLFDLHIHNEISIMKFFLRFLHIFHNFSFFVNYKIVFNEKIDFISLENIFCISLIRFFFQTVIFSSTNKFIIFRMMISVVIVMSNTSVHWKILFFPSYCVCDLFFPPFSILQRIKNTIKCGRPYKWRYSRRHTYNIFYDYHFWNFFHSCYWYWWNASTRIQYTK